LHFARFVILDDRTLVDGAALGLARPDLPIYKVFLAEWRKSPIRIDGLVRHLDECL
jgi:hypothetical protein